MYPSWSFAVWCELRRTRSNYSWLTLIDTYYNSIEKDASAQTDLNDQDIMKAVQEEKEGKRSSCNCVEAVTDRFTSSRR